MWAFHTYLGLTYIEGIPGMAHVYALMSMAMCVGMNMHVCEHPYTHAYTRVYTQIYTPMC